MRQQHNRRIGRSCFPVEGIDSADGCAAMAHRHWRSHASTDCLPYAVSNAQLRGQHLAGDLAGGVGGGETGVTAGVVDDLGDLVFGQAVVPGDLHMELQLIGRAQRDEDAERDQAAVPPAQALASPQPPEDVVDTDLQ